MDIVLMLVIAAVFPIAAAAITYFLTRLKLEAEIRGESEDQLRSQSQLIIQLQDISLDDRAKIIAMMSNQIQELREAKRATDVHVLRMLKDMGIVPPEATSLELIRASINIPTETLPSRTFSGKEDDGSSPESDDGDDDDKDENEKPPQRRKPRNWLN